MRGEEGGGNLGEIRGGDASHTTFDSKPVPIVSFYESRYEYAIELYLYVGVAVSPSHLTLTLSLCHFLTGKSPMAGSESSFPLPERDSPPLPSPPTNPDASHGTEKVGPSHSHHDGWVSAPSSASLVSRAEADCKCFYSILAGGYKSPNDSQHSQHRHPAGQVEVVCKGLRSRKQICLDGGAREIKEAGFLGEFYRTYSTPSTLLGR